MQYDDNLMDGVNNTLLDYLVEESRTTNLTTGVDTKTGGKTKEYRNH